MTFSPCTAPPSSSPPPPLPSGSPVCWQKQPPGRFQRRRCCWSPWQLGSAFGVGRRGNTQFVREDTARGKCGEGARAPGGGQQGTACPVPALDGIPVGDQLLEGLLALQDDGQLLLGERGRGEGQRFGDGAAERGLAGATSLSLLRGCRMSRSTAISNSARILASELWMQQPISRAFLREGRELKQLQAGAL